MIEFDRNDIRNVGRPSWFNVNLWLTNVYQYVTCDEVERALWLLDNPPAWYRDNYPPEAKRLKDLLLKRFFTTTDYSKDPVRTEQIGACDQDVPRAHLVVDHVRRLNAEGVIPHIVEYAPGNYWLPGVLEKEELGFEYFAPTLDHDLQTRAADRFSAHWSEPKAGHNIFVCFETIEHLYNPIEIYQASLKLCGESLRSVFLSTPKYTFGGGMGDWTDKDLGHLRAYTPREFQDFGLKHWPDLRWTWVDGHVMCLVGEK